MATTPQSDPTPQLRSSGQRRHTREEMMEIFRAARESVRPYIPKDWDQDAEMEAEHQAILAGADL